MVHAKEMKGLLTKNRHSRRSGRKCFLGKAQLNGPGAAAKCAKRVNNGIEGCDDGGKKCEDTGIMYGR